MKPAFQTQSQPRFGLRLDPDASNNFRWDFGAAVLFSAFNVVFNQFYLPMAIQQGASNVQVGLLSAAPAIGLLLSPLWAGWIERMNPKPFVIWPNLIGRALILLPAFFGAPWVYVATALAFHMLMGIQAPAYAALMTRIYPAQQRGRLMGYVRVAMGAMMIPIAYFIGLWTDIGGPSGPLVLASLTGIVSISLFFGVRTSNPAPTRSPAAKRASLKEQWTVVRENRPLAVFMVATTFSGFGNILVQPLYQITQVELLQLTNVEIGYARMAYYVCLIGALLAVGWAVDRYPPERTLTYGIAAFGVAPLLYGLFGNYPAVLVASGVQGIGDAIWDIGILAYVFRIAPGREAVVFGLHLLLFGIRGSIGPILSTALVDVVPISSLLLFAAACSFIGTALFWNDTRKRLQAA
ncbi:MFS transporter [Paenibacillus antri]|uniref:MFS transporter n=1 Tax=Paenibacillus antri TaxID=2582848 RepID=A0A5R9GB61_9BACL|nr:MFS transporter [Paenibacillus antri]TLS48645.1 MFS transporter [Paenibacillus antri]